MRFTDGSNAAAAGHGLRDTALRASLRTGPTVRGTFTAQRFHTLRFGKRGRPDQTTVSLPCGQSGSSPTATPKHLSSSSLPPSLASGRRTAVFITRGTVFCGAPLSFRAGA